MPANSTGLIEIVVDVVAQAAHEFSTQDTIAHVSQIPSGGTVLSLPDAAPSDGDVYAFADLDGSCSSGHPLHITDPNGHDIAGSATQTFTTAFAWGVVRYDAQSRLWSLMTGTVGGAGPAAASNLLVVQPGGTAAGNVFTTPAAAFTARNLINGPALIYFDITKNGGAAIHLPSAAFTEPTTFAASFDPNNTGTFAEIIADPGVTLNGVESFVNLLFVNNSTAPVITYAAQTNLRTVRFQDCEVLSPAGAALISATGGTTLEVFGYDGSIFGDGVNGPIFERDAASTIKFSIQDTSQLLNNTLSGTGGPGAFSGDYVSSATIGTALGATATLTQDSLASQTLYNDLLVNPQLGTTTVQGAIDALKQGKPVPLWQDKVAGVAVTVAAQTLPQFFNVDTTTGNVPTPFNFPPATGAGHALDGQEVTINLHGATVSAPVELAPGAGNAMADPNNAGSYGAAGATLTTNIVGQVIKRKYNAPTTEWRPF